MKKKRILFVLSIILLLCFLLFGCDKGEITSLRLTAPNGVSMKVGAKADVTKYYEREGKGEIAYAVENAEVLSLDGSTVTALKEGEAYVVITGGNHTVRLYVKVSDGKRVRYGLADTDADYDGRAHTAAFYGDAFPEGTQIELFYNGQPFVSAVDAGVYEITSRVTLPQGYIAVCEKETAFLTIHKARYRMDVSFNGAKYVYDGNEHAVFVQGTLPEGVTVRYENNRATKAGTYRAKAVFSGEDPNYEKIADMVCLLTIEKNVCSLTEKGFFDVEKAYDGQPTTPRLADLPSGATARVYGANGKEATFTDAGKYTAYADLTVNAELYDNYLFTTADRIVVFDRKGENKYVAEGLEIDVVIRKATLAPQTFVITDANGNESENIVYGQSISFGKPGGEIVFSLTGDAPFTVEDGVTSPVPYRILEPEKNSFGNYDSAVHTVTIEYDLPQSLENNYNPISSSSKTFTVKRATYDISSVTFTEEFSEKVYDGVPYEHTVKNLDENKVSVRYVLKKDGGYIEEVLHAGRYEIRAIFTLTEDAYNYEKIPDLSTVATILPIEKNLGDVAFPNKTYDYDGTEKTMAIEGELPEKFTVEYTPGNVFSQAGGYAITARFYYDKGNEWDSDYTFRIGGEKRKTLEGTLTINKARSTEADVAAIAAQTGLTYYYGMKFANVSLGNEYARWVDPQEEIGMMVSTGDTIGYVDGQAIYNPDPDNYEDYPFLARVTLNKKELDVTGVTVPEQFIAKRGSLYDDATLFFTGERYEDEVYAVTAVHPVDGTITVRLAAEKKNNYYFTGETLFENVNVHFYNPNEFGYVSGTLTLRAYYGTGKDVTVPFGTETVKENTFDGSGVTRVTIPETVTTLEKKAFAGADLLREVVLYDPTCVPNAFRSLFGTPGYAISVKVTGPFGEIPSDFFSLCSFLERVEWTTPVRRIGASAFSGCTALKAFVYDDSVLESVGSYAFSKCVSLKELHMPSLLGEEQTEGKTLAYYFGSNLSECSLETLVIDGEAPYTLAMYALRGMESLQTVTLSNALTEIGAGAFSGVGADIDLRFTNVGTIKSYTFAGYLGKNLLLPENMTTFEAYAMRGYAGEELSIPRTVTQIGKYAFSECEANVLFAADSSLTAVREGAFEGYLGTEVVLPASVTILEREAFKNAQNLRTIDLSGITSVGESCFAGCGKLEEIAFSENLTEIKGNAFKDCSALKKITFENVTPPKAYAGAYDTGALLYTYVPSSAVRAYKTYFADCGKGEGSEVIGK